MARSKFINNQPAVADCQLLLTTAKWGQFVIWPPFFTKLVYEGV